MFSKDCEFLRFSYLLKNNSSISAFSSFFFFKFFFFWWLRKSVSFASVWCFINSNLMEAFFPIIETKVLKSSSMHSLNTSILKVFSEELASTYWAEELWGSLYCLPWLRNELLSVELQCIFYERWLSHCFGTTHVHHSHWYSENTQRYSIFCLFICLFCFYSRVFER